jgi:hypothetical protein
MISNISVLNTVKDNAADFNVDADGFLNITGCPKIKAKTAKVNTVAIVQPTAGIYTVTFTAVNNYTYNFRVTGYDSSNNRITLPFSYTTAVTGATATTIATAIAAMISKSAIGAQFASVVGGATLVLTGTSANPLISFDNYTGDTSIVISAVGSGTTLGIEAQGYGADLLLAYGGFVGGSSIVATNYYTQHEITLNPDIITAGQAAYETGLTTYVVLVNASATAFAGSTDNVAMSIDLINNTVYGVVALLKAGYRAAPAGVLTTIAGVTATTGVITLSGGAVTFSTLGARACDLMVISTGTNFLTADVVTINSITTATTGVSNKYTLTTAAACKYIAVRNIPS